MNSKDVLVENRISRIRSAMEVLKADMTNSTIDEGTFSKYYLPMLMGVEGAPGSLEDWVKSVSGSPYMRVDVLDPAGNVLFVVPPILPQVTTVTDSNDRESLHNGIVRAKRKMDVSPRFAEAILMETLSNRIKSADHKPEDIEGWRYIAERYGYSDLIVTPVDPNSNLAEEDTLDEWEDF